MSENLSTERATAEIQRMIDVMGEKERKIDILEKALFHSTTTTNDNEGINKLISELSTDVSKERILNSFAILQSKYMAALSSNKPYVILEDFLYGMSEEDCRELHQYCMLLSESPGWTDLNSVLNKDKLRKQFYMPEDGFQMMTNASTNKTYDACLKSLKS